MDRAKQNKILNKLEFTLTKDQFKTLQEINSDLSSTNKMFRLLQGDVGSGKTIVSLLASYNTINSGFQVAFMAPTEILARQHFNFARFKRAIRSAPWCAHCRCGTGGGGDPVQSLYHRSFLAR